ncbi:MULTISPECIES: acyl-CoA dehydrogenase family protein [unclassified Sporolactobacillus]|uniref:acyl-CoA dehydrogenase family protein n=1 Tax=unclassified Sporolactobacillus TaxID=2628533 RepID=UPI002368036C|nr:acyl-CoA dehydrogenase family protein [Sporolactobacillus sp. CQH2019]MDD9150305.1 acyl-CoA dehydrogenase family protein [Sporolactobacillus sp. CQH2019]
MGYILNEEQTDLVDLVKKFMNKEVEPHVAEFDITGEFPRKLYEKAFKMGLHCLEIPKEFGGGGVDYMTAAAIYEEMGKTDAGFATGLCANSLSLKPVLIAGTPEQKTLFSNIVVPGAFGAFCLTEPGAGSDAGSVKTTAVKDGNDYIINGVKCFITNGGVADVYVVFASTDKSKGVKGLTAFIVEKSRGGISVGKEENKMGIRLSNTTEVIFDNVRVPAANLLGKEGEGFKIAMKTLDLARPFVGAVAVGIAQRAIEEAVKYAKERVQFGRPLAKFQAIQFMLADMDIETEAARQTVVHVIQMILAQRPYTREASIAKCFTGDVAVKVALDAIQILGGYGYSRDCPVEKLLRDAKVFQIFEGTNQVQRIVVSGNLLR